MLLPDYWLTRPAANSDASAIAAFDELLRAFMPGNGECPAIHYSLPWPKWQFLCHLADYHDIVLHGSGDPNIGLFEPRQSNDLHDFGNQKAIYAASDGLWPMFFAVVDRARVPSIVNACVRISDEAGTLHGPYYVFSVSQSALPNQPWRTGTVYILPRSTFVAQQPAVAGSRKFHIAQLASFVPVVPLAKIEVAPGDFPLLTQIRGHDDSRLQEYANAMQTSGPWPAS